MKQSWLDGELKKVFTLSEEEKIMAKGMSKSYQVLFLSLYKACKSERVTPNKISKLSPNVTDFISDQLGIQHAPIDTIPSRSKKHLLQKVRENLTFGKFTTEEKSELKAFLIEKVLTKSHHPDFVREKFHKHLKRKHLEFPSKKEEKSIIRSAQYAFEKRFFQSIFKQLPESFKKAVDDWLALHGSSDLKIGLSELRGCPKSLK